MLATNGGGEAGARPNRSRCSGCRRRSSGLRNNRRIDTLLRAEFHCAALSLPVFHQGSKSSSYIDRASRPRAFRPRQACALHAKMSRQSRYFHGQPVPSRSRKPGNCIDSARGRGARIGNCFYLIFFFKKEQIILSYLYLWLARSESIEGSKKNSG
jgi:hypothetical protein